MLRTCQRILAVLVLLVYSSCCNGSIASEYYDEKAARSHETDVHSKFAVPLTDHILWSKKFNGSSSTTAVVDSNGIIYFGGGTKLYALNPDGEEIWTYEAAGNIIGTPVLTKEETILLFAEGRTVICVDRNLGLRLWFTTLPDGGLLDRKFSLALDLDGNLILQTRSFSGSGNGRVYSIDRSSGAVSWSSARTTSSVATPTFAPDGTILISDGATKVAFWPNGTERWSVYEQFAKMSSNGVYISADDSNEEAFVVPNYAYGYDTLKLSNGSVSTWSHPHSNSKRGIAAPLLLKSGRWVMTYQSQIDGSSRNFRVLNTARSIYYDVNLESYGLTSSPAAHIQPSTPPGTDELVVFGSANNQLLILELGPTEKNVRFAVNLSKYWGETLNVQDIKTSPTVTPNGTVLISSTDGSIYAIGCPEYMESSTGRCFTSSPSKSPTSSPSFAPTPAPTFAPIPPFAFSVFLLPFLALFVIWATCIKSRRDVQAKTAIQISDLNKVDSELHPAPKKVKYCTGWNFALFCIGGLDVASDVLQFFSTYDDSRIPKTISLSILASACAGCFVYVIRFFWMRHKIKLQLGDQSGACSKYTGVVFSVAVLILEDVPQLFLTAYVLQATQDWTAVSVATIAFTTSSILFTIISPILVYLSWLN